MADATTTAVNTAAVNTATVATAADVAALKCLGSYLYDPKHDEERQLATRADSCLSGGPATTHGGGTRHIEGGWRTTAFARSYRRGFDLPTERTSATYLLRPGLRLETCPHLGDGGGQRRSVMAWQRWQRLAHPAKRSN